MDTFETLLVNSKSREKLQDLASSQPTGHLIILEGDWDVTSLAGRKLGESWLSEQARLVDLKIAVCASTKWTIQEIDEQLIEPAKLAATERAIVVVEKADRMDQGAFDHLLKTVEEPPNKGLFLFCVANSDNLPATMQGRASQIVKLEKLPVDEQVKLLVEQGVNQQDAWEVVALCQRHSGLIEQALKDPDVKNMLGQTLGGSLKAFSGKPATNAVKLWEIFEKLAEKELSNGRKPAAALVKAKAKDWVYTIGQRWGEEVSKTVQSNPDKATLVWADNTSRKLDDLVDQLDMNTPSTTVLCGFLYQIQFPSPN